MILPRALSFSILIPPLLLLTGGFSALAQDDCDYNFEPTPTVENLQGVVEDEFGDAVFLLAVTADQCDYQELLRGLRSDNPPKSGTGFLIDQERGYVLTAAHVIGQLRKNERICAIIWQKDTALELKPELPEDRQLMLLRLLNPARLPSIRAVDISLLWPSDRSFVAIGYPQVGEEPTRIAQPANLGGEKNDRIVVKQYAGGGNSGGPLFDSARLAVGIMEVKEGAQAGSGAGQPFAGYIPMSRASDLLSKIYPSDKILLIDASLRLNRLNRRTLASDLKPNSINPTNIDLYSWAKYIEADINTYRSLPARTRDLFSCPIVPAFRGRRLPDAVLSLRDIAEPRQTAEATLDIALRGLAQGSAEDAIVSATQALTAFRVAGGDQNGEATSYYILGIASANRGLFTQAVENLSKVKWGPLDTNFRLGEAQLEQNDLKGARKSFRKYLTLYSNEPDAQGARALLLKIKALLSH